MSDDEGEEFISISTEQIDKAWHRGSVYAAGGYAWIWYTAALMDLGIVACKECGGIGYGEVEVFYPPDYWRETEDRECPDCNGHGWVREDDDE